MQTSFYLKLPGHHTALHVLQLTGDHFLPTHIYTLYKFQHPHSLHKYLTFPWLHPEEIQHFRDAH